MVTTNVDWSYAVVRIWFLRLLTNRPVYYDCRLPDDLEVSRKNLQEIPGTCGLGAGWNQRPQLSGSLADLGECLNEENEAELYKKGFRNLSSGSGFKSGLWLGNESGRYWILRNPFIHQGDHITDILRGRSHIITKATF